MELKSFTIKGQRITIDVSQSGYFTARDEQGTQLAGGYQLEQVEKRAKALVRSYKRKRVAVEFLTSDFKRAVAKGIHGSTRQILVWIEVDPVNHKGKNEQWDRWRCKVLRPDTTEEDRKVLADLFAARDEVKRQIDSWEEAHTFDLRAAVEQAIKDNYPEEPSN